MYKEAVINQLVEFIRKNDGIGDKNILAQKVKEKFSLTQDRKVFCCSDFAIRFCHSENKRFSNTVLSLSALQKEPLDDCKYDLSQKDQPFLKGVEGG